MKKLLAVVALLAAATIARAAEFTDVKTINAGNAVEISAVTVTSFTATALYTSDPWDANVDIFNNSAFVLYIGTNTTTLPLTGFPILSSATYTLAGRYTGTLYGLTLSGTSANQNVRIIRYKQTLK